MEMNGELLFLLFSFADERCEFFPKRDVFPGRDESPFFGVEHGCRCSVHGPNGSILRVVERTASAECERRSGVELNATSRGSFERKSSRLSIFGVFKTRFALKHVSDISAGSLEDIDARRADLFESSRLDDFSFINRERLCFCLSINADVVSLRLQQWKQNAIEIDFVILREEGEKLGEETLSRLINLST